MAPRSIGKLIQAARQDAGLSQAALARASEQSAGVLSRIESDEREHTSFATIARIAGALGISLDDLAGQIGLLPYGRDAQASSISNLVAARDQIRLAKKHLKDLGIQIDAAERSLAASVPRSKKRPS